MNVDYPNILAALGKYLARGRTESRSFLAWFLENYYRLDEVAVYDCICDGPDDKGIDGIYVDENLERIDVFQAKIVKNPIKTLGDSQLREFAGSIEQLRTEAGVNHVAQTTGNTELKSLIVDSQIAAKVAEGYLVQGVFVTNIQRDHNAQRYLDSRDDINLSDRDVLIDSFVPPGPSGTMSSPVSFDLFGYDAVDYRTADARAIVIPLKATELVQLQGLATLELFTWNVRQSLGRTKVNKAISESVRDQQEHQNFLLYHNGITVLCSSLDLEENRCTISGYTVVNGCQSLTSLYERRADLTEDLRILTRIVELPPDSDLAAKISHHSNNQNAIKARDLQSNSNLQRRLQNEFAREFGVEVFYRIKRGEQTPSASMVIDNEEAGQVLLAFDLKQPWLCHQTYKLFDELHVPIFARPEVTAGRIYYLFRIYSAVVDSLSKIENQLLAGYRLTRFFLLYLLREALECDEVGREFCQEPSRFINSEGDHEIGSVITAASRVLEDLIVDLNAEVKDRAETDKPLDYKRELKSVALVKKFSRAIIPHYQKAVARKRASSFGEELEFISREDEHN